MFWRATSAFLISPLVITIGMLPTVLLYSGSSELQLVEVLLYALLYYEFPLFFALVFALPPYLLLNHFNLVRWWVCLVAGLLIGGIGVASAPDQSLWLSVWMVTLSGASGLVFWRIVSTYQPPKATW